MGSAIWCSVVTVRYPEPMPPYAATLRRTSTASHTQGLRRPALCKAKPQGRTPPLRVLSLSPGNITRYRAIEAIGRLGQFAKRKFLRRFSLAVLDTPCYSHDLDEQRALEHTQDQERWQMNVGEDTAYWIKRYSLPRLRHEQTTVAAKAI